MRHRVAKRHLSRTPSHLKAMRRNMAQSLFQHGQIETTLTKAKEIRPFVERLITLARKGTLQSRQRVAAIMGDRSILDGEQTEKYEAMTDAQRKKVMVARSGRRHRAGKVPAGYNKKKIPFVAQSIVHKLMTEIAPNYKDRAGGYTRIIRLPKRRIGDNSYLAILQLVDIGDEDSATTGGGKKATTGLRRQKAFDRIRYLEGKKPRRSGGRGRKASGPSGASSAPAASEKTSPDPDAGVKGEAPKPDTEDS